MTTPVKLCGEWDSRGSVRATRNAGFNSLGSRSLSEGGAIIGFVANKGRILWEAVRELCRHGNVGLVPAGQGDDNRPPAPPLNPPPRNRQKHSHA
jgi:hypothetical protein